MMNRISVLFALSVVTAGCATYSVSTVKDQADGSAVYRVDGFPTGYPLTSKTGAIYFQPQKKVPPNGTAEYGVQVEYRGNSRLFIERGETLEINIDGRSRRYSGEGSREGREAGANDAVDAGAGTSSETAYYPLMLDDLRATALGNETYVTVKGKIIQVSGRFTAGNKEAVTRFIAEYGDGPATVLK
jgi:hypothetical protein